MSTLTGVLFEFGHDGEFCCGYLQVKEILIVPMLRPDIFTGIRAPPKGLLLFGPPGTGKTLIGRCIASQAKCTFFWCVHFHTLFQHASEA